MMLFSFGGGTEMLRDGDIDGSWQALKDGLEYVYYLCQQWQLLSCRRSMMMIFDHLPWLSYIAKQFPTAKTIKNLRARAMERTEDRYKRGAAYKDLFYYLVRRLSMGRPLSPG